MVGKRLREMRKKANITQSELAALLGTKKSAISLYENDKSEPNDRYKILMAKRMDVSLDYLLGVINEPIPYYSANKMVILPENFSEKNLGLLKDFIAFIEYRDSAKEETELR